MLLLIRNLVESMTNLTMLNDGIETAQAWGEIPDMPDGRPVPQFLVNIDESQYGLRPVKDPLKPQPAEDS